MGKVWFYGEGNPKQVFTEALSSPPEAIAIDTETVSIKDKTVLGIGIAVAPDKAFYFDCTGGEWPRELFLLDPIMANPRVKKVAHNWMFDLYVMPRIPIKFDRSNMYDTSIAVRLQNVEASALGDLYKMHQCPTTPMSELMKTYKCNDHAEKIPPMVLAEHCAQDTMATLTLYHMTKDWVDENFKDYFNVECKVMPILADMGKRGLKIDQPALVLEVDRVYKLRQFYLDKIRSMSEYIKNPNSPQQVAMGLIKRGNYLPPNRKQTAVTTGEKVLMKLKDPMAMMVYWYRHYNTQYIRYLKPLVGMNRFTTEYHCDTIVFRLASARRNIQNIPAPDEDAGEPGCRHILLPDNGLFTWADYSQEHMFILAHQSQDKDLLEVLYSENPHLDIHTFTAERMGVPRGIAKTLNYAVVYGATAETVMESAKTGDLAAAQYLIDLWFDTYRGAAEWIRIAQEEGMRDGLTLPTIFNRRIKLNQAEGRDRKLRKCVNYPILGSDGEVMKRAILECADKKLGPPIMCITLHDELVFDGDIDVPVEEMAMVPGFRIPVDVKKGEHWV